MKSILTALTLILVGASALAALPPYWDSVRQFDAVMNSALSDKMHGSLVGIENLGNLKFRVHSAFCTAEVTLAARVPRPPMVGATAYSLKSIDQMTCE